MDTTRVHRPEVRPLGGEGVVAVVSLAVVAVLAAADLQEGGKL